LINILFAWSISVITKLHASKYGNEQGSCNIQSRKRTLQECNRCLWQLQITLTQILNIISICNSIAILLLCFEFEYSLMMNEYLSWTWKFFSTPDCNLGFFFTKLSKRTWKVYCCEKYIYVSKKERKKQ